MAHWYPGRPGPGLDRRSGVLLTPGLDESSQSLFRPVRGGVPLPRMDLPVGPPLEPMLGRLVRDLPRDGFLYEPKWDGFRCVAFRDGEEIDLRSRHGRPLARYFPELVEAMAAITAQQFVVDGEIVAITGRGFDFPALMARLHPAASRVELLRRRTPAEFVGFDLLALGQDDLTGRPLAERRALVETLLEDVNPPLHLTPATEDPAVALDWIDRFQGAGIDGVMAKGLDQPYRPGARAMIKVKSERTADCVVAGFRVFAGEPVVASLLLGLYDEAGELQHVGVSSSFRESVRRELFAELSPGVVPLERHPWRSGFLVAGGPMGRLPGAAATWTPDFGPDWAPLPPERVCEVAYDQLDDHRFRHPARFRRWRPDRDSRSCTLDQITPAGVEPEALLR
jgi:ATP-dependent DNA ligase